MTIEFPQQVWSGCVKNLDGPVALAKCFVGQYSAANDLSLARRQLQSLRFSSSVSCGRRAGLRCRRHTREDTRGGGFP